MIHLVARIDDNGTVAVVEDGLSEAAAAAPAERRTARGHQQTYLVLSHRGGADRATRLRDLGGGCAAG